jgi:hypothetical protein
MHRFGAEGDCDDLHTQNEYKRRTETRLCSQIDFERGAVSNDNIDDDKTSSVMELDREI